MSWILSDFDNYMQFSNDDGEWIALQGVGEGFIAIKKSDVPVSDPPDMDSFPVYYIRYPQS